MRTKTLLGSPGTDLTPSHSDQLPSLWDFPYDSRLLLGFLRQGLILDSS